MGTYVENIDTHVLNQTLPKLLTELEVLTKKGDIPPTDLDGILQVQYVLMNFSSAFEKADHRLVASAWVDDANTACTQIINNITNYKNSPNATYITNSVSQLETLLRYSAMLNVVNSRQGMQGVQKAQVAYEETVNSHVKTLGKQVDSLNNVLEELRQASVSHKAELDRQATQFASTITNEQSRLDSLATAYQTQMTEDKTKFVTAVQGYDSTVKQIIEDFLVEQKTLKESFNETAKKELDEERQASDSLITTYEQKFDEYEKQVQNIVGIVNTNMFSHKYKEVADDAHKRARFWHGLAIGLMVLVALFAFYAFVMTLNEDAGWVRLVAKIFATTTIATGAAYSARQASKQEKVERYARKIEMELVAIDPFIDSLDNEKKEQIKEDLTKRIFGNADSMEISNKDEAHHALDKISTTDEVIKTLVAVINKLAK